MKVEKISLQETGYFSNSFLEYVAASEKLTPFYTATPTIEHFDQVIKNRSFSKNKREKLVEVLKTQYRELSCSGLLNDNIESLLSDKTFTITTGHQLNIFTGPLYFIYKIVTVINAAKELKKKYPDYHFVPVYWMATEDHDFEEISYFWLHGKKHQWKTEQTGAVGHFDPSELKEILDKLPGDITIFKKAYLENKTLTDACRQYVNALFGEEGLVVVDADDADLKRELITAMKADIFDQTPHHFVTKQSDKLSSLGFKIQVNCREINFFYMVEGVRVRIEKSGDRFVGVDSDLSFSKDEIEKLINDHPERFSPNVILRPLYQELILPNLAYVGGPSELVYWLQLKSMFEHFEVQFPILMPRNFGTILPAHLSRTWSKTGLSNIDLFLDIPLLEKKWLKENGGKKLSYEEAALEVSAQYESMKVKAADIDPTLVKHIEALKVTALIKIEKAEKKLIRADKRNHEDAMRQLATVKEAIFPNGSLQERRDNFLNFYQENPNFINELLDAFDPFDYRMHLLLQ